MQILLIVWHLAVQQNLRKDIYVNKDGVKVYTTDVIVDEQEFAESKAASENSMAAARANSYQVAPKPEPSSAAGDGFMNIPDGIDEELPFS